jgi:hypothetical protein
MGLFTSDKLHAHTSDACVQAFCASMQSWRARHKTDPNAHPPRRRKWYPSLEYKRRAIEEAIAEQAEGTLSQEKRSQEERLPSQDEHHTSKTCPVCEHRRKTAPNGRVFTCTNQACKWCSHRDGVGAITDHYRAKVSGLRPRSWSYGTSHGNAIPVSFSRSSWATARSRFGCSPRRSVTFLMVLRTGK